MFLINDHSYSRHVGRVACCRETQSASTRASFMHINQRILRNAHPVAYRPLVIVIVMHP